jgi:hypothetical protein
MQMTRCLQSPKQALVTGYRSSRHSDSLSLSPCFIFVHTDGRLRVGAAAGIGLDPPAMLDLLQTYSGCPSNGLHYLVLKHDTFIVCDIPSTHMYGLESPYWFFFYTAVSIRRCGSNPQCSHTLPCSCPSILGGISRNATYQGQHQLCFCRLWDEIGTRTSQFTYTSVILLII